MKKQEGLTYDYIISASQRKYFTEYCDLFPDNLKCTSCNSNYSLLYECTKSRIRFIIHSHRLLLSHVTNELMPSVKFIWQPFPFFRLCPTAPRRKLIAADVHDSHGSGYSLFLFPSPPMFYLMHKSRKFLVRAPFRPSECGHA